jgi:hypothetical protein
MLSEKKGGRQAGRQAGRQTDRQTNRQTDTQIERKNSQYVMLHRKKRFTSFPSPDGMSQTKLPLGKNNSVMTSLFPPRESLVVTSRLGTGNSPTFFYGVCYQCVMPNFYMRMLKIEPCTGSLIYLIVYMTNVNKNTCLWAMHAVHCKEIDIMFPPSY